MRVLIVTGSSGGHIFPALALINSLKNSCAELLLVLPKKSKDNNIPVGYAQVKYIRAAALSFNLSSKNIVGAGSFLWGAWEGMLIILKFRPDVVVGFGSLNTVALIFWAWIFRVKTIIHEQNVIPGRANRLLAKLVDRVAVSFRQTNNYLNISAEKIVYHHSFIKNNIIFDIIGHKNVSDETLIYIANYKNAQDDFHYEHVKDAAKDKLRARKNNQKSLKKTMGKTKI